MDKILELCQNPKKFTELMKLVGYRDRKYYILL